MSPLHASPTLARAVLEGTCLAVSLLLARRIFPYVPEYNARAQVVQDPTPMGLDWVTRAAEPSLNSNRNGLSKQTPRNITIIRSHLILHFVPSQPYHQTHSIHHALVFSLAIQLPYFDSLRDSRLAASFTPDLQKSQRSSKNGLAGYSCMVLSCIRLHSLSLTSCSLSLSIA